MTTPANTAPVADRPVERRQDYKHFRATASILALAIAFGTIVGGVGSALGFKRYGPPEQIAEIRQDVAKQDSLVTARIGRVEAAAAQVQTDLTAMRNNQEFHSYLLCVILRRTDNAAVPRQCQAR